MSTLTTPIPFTESTDVVPAKRVSPDHVLGRLLASGRVVVGGGILTIIVLACVGTLPLTLRDKSSTGQKNPFYFDQQNSDLARKAPIASPAARWLGTDTLGRSMLARSLLGGCISLAIGVAAASISVVLGVSVGLVAGYRGGMIDAVLMRSVDILYGLPYVLLIILLKIALEPALGGFSFLRTAVILLAVVFLVSRTLALIEALRGAGLTRWRFKSGQTLCILTYPVLLLVWRNWRRLPMWEVGINPAAANLVVLFLAIGLVSWLTMARVVRGQVLSLRGQPFIEACRACGLTEWRIFTRHLLPNLIGPISVYATLTVPQAILQESFLSFLGIGIQPPIPTWGALASEGLLPALNPINHYWYLLVTPCVLLSITLLSLNFLGDGLRDVFDPKRDAAKS